MNPAPWSKQNTLNLEPLWILCKGRRDAHQCSATFYNRLYKSFSFPNVLIGSVLSTLTFSPEDYPPSIATSLSIFMTVLATTSTFFNFSQRAEGHRTTQKSFTILIRDMEMCILRGQISPKREYADFLEHINDRFTELIEDAPPLHSAAQNILNNVRRTRPSPFDSLREEPPEPQAEPPAEPYVNEVPGDEVV